MKIKIGKAKGKGRAVFACGPIRTGELIEVCELLLLGHEEISASLERYVYWYTPKKAAIALGCGSLYNHSPDPNAAFEISRKTQQLKVRALRSIAKGEEITFDYGYDEALLKKFSIR